MKTYTCTNCGTKGPKCKETTEARPVECTFSHFKEFVHVNPVWLTDEEREKTK